MLGRASKKASLMMSAAVLVLAGSIGVMADTHKELCEGFLPQNDMKIPVGAQVLDAFGTPTTGGITEAQFNGVMDRIQLIYADDVKQQGGVLKINRLWTDATVNASAEENGTDWVLNMYGGLARHPKTTIEGMALVVCHELGHHLGGAPKVAGWFGDDWATNEGGADYFATIKCMRRFFADDDNATAVAAAKLEPIVTTQCAAQFTTPKDVLLCERSAMAGMSVAGLFQDLGKEKVTALFATPDKTQVTVTNDDHPETQCRLDTYFAGASCPVDISVKNSRTDFKEGSCVQGVDAIGFRPRCWFQPGK